MLYEKLPNNKVRCFLCGRRCIIPEDNLGFCNVRKNVGGILNSLNYGKACVLNVDPIEKKPLSHFHPGSMVLSIATVGCNFRCQFCDNWEISQETGISGRDILPDEVVKEALDYECKGISYTYTEPTIFFEYAYATADIAHQKGLFNTFVTNGYMTTDAVKKISPYLDAATVDFKGGADPDFYRKFSSVPSVEPIFDALKQMKQCGIHIEITNLVIPKIGDSMDRISELTDWIHKNLGKDTPFHLLRFHPDFRVFEIPSTEIQVLEKAYEISCESGLNYVYLGNVPGHRYENTYCPQCKDIVVQRYGFRITRWRLNNEKRCLNCGKQIAMEGNFEKQ